MKEIYQLYSNFFPSLYMSTCTVAVPMSSPRGAVQTKQHSSFNKQHMNLYYLGGALDHGLACGATRALAPVRGVAAIRQPEPH